MTKSHRTSFKLSISGRSVTGGGLSILMIMIVLPALLPAQTNTFPTSGSVGIGTTSPQYPLDVVGAIHTSGNLVLGSGQTLGQSVTFTPAATTTGEWYRILTGPESMGGTVRIYAHMDNTYNDVEVQFNIGGYTTDPGAASIVETRFSTYSGGNALVVDQVRASSDGGSNVYFDIHISHAWTPAPITVSVDGPDIFPPSPLYPWGLLSSPALVTGTPPGTNVTLALGPGVRSTAGANLAGNVAIGGNLATAGNVGIGTQSPLLPLHVNSFVTQSSAGGVFISDATGTGTTPGVGGQLIFGGNYNGSSQTGWSMIQGTKENGTAGDYAGALVFLTRPNGSGQTEQVRITSSGNVGIGATNPVHELQVAGIIGAQEIMVTSTGADYVFDPHYKLQSLKDVAAYVSANHHLPGIPSAQEMKDSGVSLGEIQTKLLAKIEELTLHLIQEEQKNDQLARANDSLLKRVQAIEAAIAKP